MAIYLDNQTVTRPSTRAVEAMIPFLKERWGSPGAPYSFGQELLPVVGDAFRSIYKLLGASKEAALIATSGAAEAIAQIYAALPALALKRGRNHLITTNVEEAPITLGTGRLDLPITTLSVGPEGYVTAQAFAEALTPRTLLATLSWANGLTGVLQPIEEIATLCRDRGVLLHLDATHLIGKIPFSLAELPVDFVTFEGVLFHAPRGTGGLYIRPGLRLSAFIPGSQAQGGLRSGPLNLPSLIALGRAAEEALLNQTHLLTETARLRNTFEEALLHHLPTTQPLFRSSERLPHITALAFPGADNDALLYLLNRRGLFASFGGENYRQIALILQASNLDPSLARSALSFGLSLHTTDQEIDEAVKIVAGAAAQLQRLSQKIEK